MLEVDRRSDLRIWRDRARAAGERVALVPTMGYLHAGHLSLVEIARRSVDRVAVSIFVNPLQFGPGEDLDRYPRDLDRDRELLSAAGVELLFVPSAAEMYPAGEPWVAVVPERGAELLCGASRPGHFRGVLTVVAKLFGIVRPDLAVFGQKDFQQLALIRRMVLDLDFAVEILAGPIVRDPDGLAMSSRNTYLSTEERSRALALPRSLEACRERFRDGERDPARLRAVMREVADTAVQLEYAEVIDPHSLDAVEQATAESVCLVAGRVGRTRLIDNARLGE